MFRRLILTLTGLMVGIVGYSQNLPDKILVDQIVAVVGNSAILYSQVENAAKQVAKHRKDQGFTLDRDPMHEALENLLVEKLLYNQAMIDSVKIASEDIDQMVEQSVLELINQYGSASAMEASTKTPMFDLRSSMAQNFTEKRYAQTLQQQLQSKVTITPGEVNRFYRNMHKDSLPLVPEQYIYAHITKFPPSLKEAKQRTREKLLELRERIIAGMRFDALARMYSEDGSAPKGGEMDPAPKESFVTPFADALVKLKPGQVSEVVETQFGFHIIELISKNGNLYHCRHILIRPTFVASELRATTTMLDSLVTQISEGHITFEQAALDNSDDAYSKLNAGIVSNHEILEMYNAGAQYTSTRFPKEELPPNDYRTLATMKPGEISKAFLSQDQKGNELGKVIKLVSIIPTHPANISEDYLSLENIALQEKQNKAFLEWLNKKIDKMYVRVDEEFKGNDFVNKNWLK